MLRHTRTACKANKGEDQIEALRKELAELRSSNTTTTYHTATTFNSMAHTINVSVVALRDFGGENLDHINGDWFAEQVAAAPALDAETLGGVIVEKAITDTWCNPKKPENWTVYIPNRRQSEALVRRDGRWSLTALRQATAQIQALTMDALNSRQSADPPHAEIYRAIFAQEESKGYHRVAVTTLANARPLLEGQYGRAPRQGENTQMIA